MSCLKNILLAGILTLGIVRCDTHNQYHFNDKIEDDKIEFYESIEYNLPLPYLGNVLKIAKPNGVRVIYIDSDNDLKLDKFIIVRGENNRSTYDSKTEDSVELNSIKNAQIKFDAYLKSINDFNINLL